MALQQDTPILDSHQHVRSSMPRLLRESQSEMISNLMSERSRLRWQKAIQAVMRRNSQIKRCALQLKLMITRADLQQAQRASREQLVLLESEKSANAVKQAQE